MATRYNYTGQLVTDGLVLNLDAAKRDSYPGSGTTWYDLSGNGNNGTLINGPTYTGVSKDAAIVFDGVDDYVGCGNNIATTSSITVNSWVNLDINNDYQHIVDSSANTWHLAVLNNGRAYFYDGNEYHRSGSILPTGSWCMATGVKDGSKNTIYVNGSPSDTITSTNTIPTNTVSIARWDGTIGVGKSRYLNGNIAQTQIYNRSLSQFEVFQNFNAMKGRYGIPDIVTDGLVLNLDAGNPYSYLSGSSGTTWTDVSGNGNNGTLTNGASYENGAIVFDGVNDYVDCGNNSTLSFTQGGGVDIPFSINLWVYPTSYGLGALQYGTLISKSQFVGSWTREFNTTITSTTVGFTLFVNDFNYIGIRGTIPLSLNTWSNVCFTYDGSKTLSGLKLYINSNLQTTTTTSAGTYTGMTNTGVSINIGRQNNTLGDSGYLKGNIANTLVYRNKTLSSQEVLQNYNATKGRFNL